MLSNIGGKNTNAVIRKLVRQDSDGSSKRSPSPKRVKKDTASMTSRVIQAPTGKATEKKEKDDIEEFFKTIAKNSKKKKKKKKSSSTTDSSSSTSTKQKKKKKKVKKDKSSGSKKVRKDRSRSRSAPGTQTILKPKKMVTTKQKRLRQLRS